MNLYPSGNVQARTLKPPAKHKTKFTDRFREKETWP